VKAARTGAAVAVFVVVAVLGVQQLRAATQSSHVPVASKSRVELIVDARIKGAQSGQTLAEMVTAQVLMCRLQVSSDVVGGIQSLGNGRFRAVLTPSMDRTDRRQFRGCLEDWALDYVHLDVVRLAPS
jgi:hypothetical protein